MEDILGTKSMGSKFLPRLGGRGDNNPIAREFPLQSLNYTAHSDDFSDRDGMKPNRRLPTLRRQMLWNASDSLAQPGTILAMAHHLYQPIGHRYQKKDCEQRAVEHVHFEVTF
jgi:hypothetical protein